MQHRVTIASTLLLVVSAIAASAADQSIWDQCNQTRDKDASITACTQILQAPSETVSDRADCLLYPRWRLPNQGR